MLIQSIDVSFRYHLISSIMTTLGSLAIPAIPTASPVTIIIILSSMNIDATRVGLLMALEWYT